VKTSMARVRDVALQIRGVTYAKTDVRDSPQPGYVPILRANNISTDGLVYDDLVFVPSGKVKPTQIVQKNDVLIAASSGSLSSVGKAVRIGDDFVGAFGAFCKVLRPGSCIDPDYFAHFFRTRDYRQTISALATGVNINNIKNEHLDNLEIPAPSIEKQQRIAHVLNAADALRAKRRLSMTWLNGITEAIFWDMFGDPGADSRYWPTEPLSTVCRCVSGSTPPKSDPSSWSGNVPWFSAKDLKAQDLYDSADHITEPVVTRGKARLLPSNTVVAVVRGMILQHTVPVSILRIPAVINQDLKAFLPRGGIEPDFLAACLRVQSARMLKLVSTAAHGTKRLDSNALATVRIILPPGEMQRAFVRRTSCVHRLRERYIQSRSQFDALFASLQDRAFKGEL
jgi:type I restriction enzyme, S subunit